MRNPVGAPRRGAGVRRGGPAAALALSVAGLGAGALLRAAGLGAAGDGLWVAVTGFGGLFALWSMVEGLRAGRLGVDLVAVLAVGGALAVHELLAGAVIGVMLTTGRALESWASRRARRDMEALLGRAPRTARRHCPSGLEVVDVDAVRQGDLLVVGPGEILPVDGTVVSGTAVLDESTLTGEAVPVDHGSGDAVRSGTVNAGGPFDLRATTSAADSTYAGIVRLVAEAEASQGPFVRLADRYALWFLLGTLGLAGAAWAAFGAARAVAVLVVATPCPLILAVPVALVSGLSVAARRGVVVKGGAVLECLARCTTLLVDKTGTLTGGRPTLVSVVPAGPLPATEVLELAASLDQVSPHVLAGAVVRGAAERGCALSLPEDVEEVPGFGIRGLVDGRRVALGKAEWAGIMAMPEWARAARRRAELQGAPTVFVSVDGTPVGVLVLDDPVRADAGRTLRGLRRSGVKRIVMVSGDRPVVAESIGAVIGVDEVLAERTPAEKLDVVRLESSRAPTVMVGDGVNDAPALALADVGVAMGARGATASSEAADIVLAVDRIDRLGEAMAVARRARRIAVQSVVVGMGLSVVAMAAATAGLLPAVWGALSQEAIDVVAILNALRVLRSPPAAVRLDVQAAALSRRFHDEHRGIRDAIDELRRVADVLGAVPGDEAMARLRAVHRVLVEDVAPHEAAEQDVLYPALDRLLGGSDPTGTMSRAHGEIAHQIRRFGQVLDDVGPAGPDDVDVVELRRLLYGLHAVLSLHTTQEEESYLSLTGEEPDRSVAPTRGGRTWVHS